MFGTTTVDYILFITAPVTLAPNLNEVCDTKWVSPTELKSLMEELDPASFTPWFKLIVQQFLFPWWDVLLSKRTTKPISEKARQGQEEAQQGEQEKQGTAVVDAKQLAHLKDNVIHRML